LSLVLLTACSFGAESNAPPPPAEPSTSPPPAPAAAPPLDGAPDGSELTEELGVFVAEHGTDDGDGSRTRPLRSIQKGIDMAKAAGKRVYVCAGEYREALVLADGLPLVGDLACSDSTWTTGDARARIVAPTSPAVRANAIATPTRLEGFEITAPDATAPGTSSIALLANDSPGLTIARSRLVAGRGADGKAGTNGVQLEKLGVVNPGNGELASLYACGKLTNCDPSLPGAFPRHNGGVGGQLQCAGAAGHDPGAGGAGGSGGTWEWANGGWTAYANNFPKYGTTIGLAPPNVGVAGAPGTSGKSGSGGTFTKDGFVASDGTAGTDGQPGAGGKGGDGVYPGTQAPANFSDVYVGNGGGGGGAGGCPGLAGAPGTGGGASVGALLWNSPVAFVASELVSGRGGAGGMGTFGSEALAGETGGIGYAAAAVGGRGGDGGQAGVSGSGAGGPSFAIAHSGTKPQLDADTKLTAGDGGSGVSDQYHQTDLGTPKRILAAPAGKSEALHPLP
jgi:hypothetical protein